MNIIKAVRDVTGVVGAILLLLSMCGLDTPSGGGYRFVVAISIVAIVLCLISLIITKMFYIGGSNDDFC